MGIVTAGFRDRGDKSCHLELSRWYYKYRAPSGDRTKMFWPDRGQDTFLSPVICHFCHFFTFRLPLVCREERGYQRHAGTGPELEQILVQN